ncbi:adenylate/guanylate cyclase domain-containing protein [Gimesia aquarii]|uniref:Adenylate cyclase 2 n=1 Tax=Gimesia aquarii TaxID=2527964 RepID=A0A517WV54_9PLAN|nr:adenylate/guanylate cyclase domain-containing protein [Gimesia aquarii]QDU09147.1 Adenylate cyclase 2 [Gimesia aquarii]
MVYGSNHQQSCKFSLETGQELVLGRSVDADVQVLWDDRISRKHALLTVQEKQISVKKFAAAENHIYSFGEESDELLLEVGNSFVIGSTTFQLVDSASSFSSPRESPLEEVTFKPNELLKVKYRDADQRIDVLAHLPELIMDARNDADLFHRLVTMLLSGVKHAEAVAVVRLNDENRVEVPFWERRRQTQGNFRPSGRLVLEAVKKSKRTVLHVWAARDELEHQEDYTAVAEFDWAFCTPIEDGASGNWGLYVAGELNHPYQVAVPQGVSGIELQADVKFTELVASIIKSVRRLNQLERQQAGLRQFFAPPILSAIGDNLDTDILEPRECDVTVLFCDLRGFSQHAEDSSGDLIGLLDRVSQALGIMTSHILEFGGVTGDFQGDAALGFWGWPFSSDLAPLDACRAALAIRAAFEQINLQANHPLADFRMGIGIAHGKAVAGKIGTSDQVKVTVFGPVVNLASRLEGLTKHLRVPVLMDETTAQIVKTKLDQREGRVRKLAQILPYGMEKPVIVSELLPPESKLDSLSNEQVVCYETAVNSFIQGNWEEAFRLLHEIPPSDRAQDFLAQQITRNNRVAPTDWDGTIRFDSK